MTLINLANMKKYSNDPIPVIVDLGDGKYEFCFNHTTEEKEDHLCYISDVVTIEGFPNRQFIISELMADGKTEPEANNLVVDLVI